jgi:hypothetical protein
MIIYALVMCYGLTHPGSESCVPLPQPTLAACEKARVTLLKATPYWTDGNPDHAIQCMNRKTEGWTVLPEQEVPLNVPVFIKLWHKEDEKCRGGNDPTSCEIRGWYEEALLKAGVTRDKLDGRN